MLVLSLNVNYQIGKNGSIDIFIYHLSIGTLNGK